MEAERLAREARGNFHTNRHCVRWIVVVVLHCFKICFFFLGNALLTGPQQGRKEGRAAGLAGKVGKKQGLTTPVV